jgi:hypothetical protein
LFLLFGKEASGGMKALSWKSFLWPLGLLVFAMPGLALAQVSVYAEGAYTATDLAVYIYADINPSNPLCSFGVALNYDENKLNVTSAKINEKVWYFGSPPPNNIACPNCVSTTSGKIIFLGPRLDTSNPPASTTAGVKGSRVLLAKATFSREPGKDANFGVLLSLGKDHPPFDNFVTSNTPTVVLDNPSLFATVTIRERGDANADGVITNSDMFKVKDLIQSNIYKCFADCNNDEVLTNSDMFCIKGKI